MSIGKGVWRIFTILFIVLTLMGCNASKTVIKETLEVKTEDTSSDEVSTPDDQMALAKKKVEEEMRIFDVNAHHDALYAEIVSLDKALSETELKAAISQIVKDYMDAYFLEKTRKILSEYNEYYTDSEVESLFEGTSRASLYKLIELYELSFHNKNR
jgi:uncharacterized lipoprotein NlpE involved in copper resistance